MPSNHQSPGPTCEETGATRVPLVLEFGTACWNEERLSAVRDQVADG